MIKKLFKGKVAVFIDAANLESSVNEEGYKLNHKRLARFFKKKTNLVLLSYYTVRFLRRSHRDFLASLKRFGFLVKTKPLKVIKDKNRGEIHKANFDVEITVDALNWADKFETIVLFSGDSDFNYLLRDLKKKRKRAIVVSLRGHIARELVRTAYFYIPLTKFPRILKKKRRR